MTLRQTYIDELVAMFEATPGFPAAVGRTLADAFDREEGDVLVIHRGADVPNRTIGESVERNCEIRFSTVTRGGDPEGDADRIMEAAHPLIVAFRSRNLMSVKEVKTAEPMYANGDGRACLITTHYLFAYKTPANSLSE